MKAGISNFLTTFIVLLCLTPILQGQVVNLGCQSHSDATIGIDRKNWNNGNTSSHSEGYMLNFDLPTNTFGDCKKITEVEIEFTINNIDESGIPADCLPGGIGAYWTNLYLGCPDFSPASCPVANILDEFPSDPIGNQTLTYTCPPEEFPFGEVLGVDIIPAVANVGCTDGQSMISMGHVSVDFEICVIVTVDDDVIDMTVDLGADETICGGQTFEIDAGPGFSQYDWDPNGESTQSIIVGGGIYSVTVTDSKGCTDEDEIEIIESVVNVSIMSDDADETICENTTTVLTANTTATDIEWSTSETTNSIVVGPGMYSVTVTDANDCEAEDMIVIGSFPEPMVMVSPTTGEVCGMETLQVDATPGFTTYDWGGGIMGQTVQLGAGNYILTITDNNGCMATAMVDITSIDPPEAGDDVNLFQVCNDGSTYDIDAQLGTNDDTGNWSDVDGSGINLNINDNNVSFANVDAGLYDFTYTVAGTNPCMDDEATITIEVADQPNAGMDNSADFCNDGTPIDLEALLGTFDPGGNWTDVDDTSVDLGDPSSVDFTGVNEGSYEFTYELSANFPCTDDQAQITINLFDFVSAGDNNTVSVCEGSLFDLTDALSMDATLGGDFVDVDGSGELSGSIFNTTGLEDQSFDFDYMVGSGGSCGSDESTITVEVVSSVFAGDDNLSNEICIDETIDLFDFIPNADIGGDFNDISMSGELSGSIFDAPAAGAGDYTFEYVIGDGITCPADMSTIEITLFEAPEITISQGAQLCSDQCALINIDLSGNPDFSVSISIHNGSDDSITDTIDETLSVSPATYWICNDGGNGNFLNDTIHIGDSASEWYLLPVSLNDANCQSFFSNTNNDTTFFQITESITTLLDPTICMGDSVIVNGVTYNMANPTGTEMLTSSADCDSIVNVALEFYDVPDSLLQNTICMGDSIEINGVFYSEQNPIGSSIIENGSLFGCDSIVNVSLSFHEMPDSLLQVSVCQGDSIEVNGVFYSEQNPNGSSIIENGSQFGCDSLVQVSLNVYEVPDSLLQIALCSGDSVEVNGIFYGEMNMSGSSLLEGQSQFGCDSLVNVEVSIENQIDSLLTIDLCQGEVVVVNGVTYDETNPTGSETLQSADACDTLVMIDLSFNEIYAFNFDENICTGDSIFLEGDWQFTSGTYTDNFTSIAGCDSTVTTVLTVEACQSQVSINSINNTCFGGTSGSIKLIIESGVSPFMVSWLGSASGTSGDVMVDMVNEEICIENLVSDQYDITIVDGNGIQVGMEMAVIIDENPEITGNIDILNQVTCFDASDGSIQANIQGGSGNYTYNWMPNLGVTDILDNIPAGNYELEVADDLGCTANFMMSVSNPEVLTASISSLNTTCSLATDGSINISEISGGTGPYMVSIDGDLVSNPASVPNLAPGQYSVEILDVNGCDYLESIEVFADANPSFLAYETLYEIELGDSIQLQGTISGNTSSIIWGSDVTLSCTDCPNPIASPAQSQTYNLTVTNEAGCVDEIIVSVVVVQEENEIFFPTAFSPNGDGINDTFDIFQSVENIDIQANFKLYDRWGNLLVDQIQLTGVGNGWNGRADGSLVSPGVYVYLFSYVDSNNQTQTKTGELTVVR